MSKNIVRTYIIKIPKKYNNVCEELSLIAGRVYSKTVSFVKKIYEKKKFWVSEYGAKKYLIRWSEDIPIHTHSKQAIMESYFESLKGFFVKYKKDKKARPPFRTRKFKSFIWKNTAVKIRDGYMILSLGRGQTPLRIETSLKENSNIRKVVLVWKKTHYDLHVSIKSETVNNYGENLIAIDLGIIHPMVTYDGVETKIYNGRYLNSIIRYRNKRLGEVQSLLSKCMKGSRRYTKLNKVKIRVLNKTNNQIKDILSKYTSNLISYCIENKIGTIVIGDIKHIRDNKNFGKLVNQKLHQWMFSKMTKLVEDKAEDNEIKVKFQDESYTSQTCPNCGTRHKPKNRNYKCCTCGFEYHRDGVGAINIFKKYLGLDQVVGELTPPIGIRYNEMLCGQGSTTIPWKYA